MALEGQILRQIHLDFHTSEGIPSVGHDFDADAFADELVRADVNSIILFARCHHGFLYYPGDESILGPVHPGLKVNLLPEQVAACKARGINVTVYTTVQWDVLTASRHPEWRIQLADGSLEGTPPFEAGFYRKLSLDSDYAEVFKRHIDDILCQVSPDGLYFDFIRPDLDVSPAACARMVKLGLDPSSTKDQEAYGIQVANRYELEVAEYVRSRYPGLSITFNGGHIGLRHRDAAPAYTHFEMETLPSGGWGYMYFPVTGRYARTLGPDCVGTTGKFHSTWGDFHSLKNQAALEYEVFRMIAQGAGCSIGDQLHPSGVLDVDTYRLIGGVYSSVKAKEPWCVGAKPVTEIGVFNPEELLGGGVMDLPAGIQGLVRMLDEGGHQFDVIDSRDDFSRYRLLILPDYIRLTDDHAKKIRQYVENGGAVIASFESGLAVDKNEFVLSEFGVKFASEGPVDDQGRLARGRWYERHDFAQYVRAREGFGWADGAAERPIYLRGTDVAAEPGSEVLVDFVKPYFDRSWRHYISHLQAPSTGETGGPAVVRNGNVIYIASPVATQYEQCAPRWVKSLVLAAIDAVLGDHIVSHDGPSTLEISVMRQQAQERSIVHLLHYVPERRGNEFDTVEDVLPLYDVKVSLHLTEPVTSVTLEPQGKALAFETVDNRVEFTVPKVEGHQMISISGS